MSKIYEALLRAELERANRTGPSTNGSQAAETALANTLEEYVPEPQPHFQETSSLASQTLAIPVAEPRPFVPAPVLPQHVVAQPFAPQTLAAPQHAPSFVPAAAPVGAPSFQSAPFSPAAPVPVPASAQEHKLDVEHDARVSAWNPVVERLPALLERGRGVEQFRSLRSRLAEFRDSSQPLKSVLITSGLPQEGKSFIAANLALSLSRHRANRVLLIDGDIRRSSLHAMLGTPAEPGLTDYLSGRTPLADVLQRCQGDESEASFHSGLTSLTFISGGSEPDKAADLSGSPRFANLLTTLGEQFDWIIIDSSPVNLVSDGVNFARMCDGVLLVAREGVTKFETAQHAQQELKSTRILGFVLNAVHTASAKTDEYNYGPYGTYGSYGGYGYSTTKR